jgi:signal transduction histidine kinase
VTRWLPKSLLGQVTLAVALTLFIVQGVNGLLAWSIEKDRAETGLVNTLSLRLVASARIREGGAENIVARIDPGRETSSRGEQDRPRRMGRRFSGTDFTRETGFETLPQDRTMPELQERLAETLRENGREFTDIRLVERPVSADPIARRFLQRLALRRGYAPEDLPDSIAIAGITDGNGWDVVRAPIRKPHEEFGPLFPLLQAGALTLLLSFVLWLVLRRITGPLAQLTTRTEEFSRRPGQSEPMEPHGPDDVRRLIGAHNAMEARIGAMLAEKDVMLGAIGHDLKTPLAALRVRVESVENAAARERMIDSIEDITLTLDEILALARVGKSDAAPERTDLAALAASVVEEFEDMGETVELETQRIVAPIHLTWLKRGLRNLVSNALRYGGNARLTVLREGDTAVLRVEDSGPGIPEDRIADMLEPFTRGEASRNRATGGAGLGLTLARAVAEQHGGEMNLSNRPEGGLRAEFRLPL